MHWLGLCQNAIDTSKNTKATLKCCSALHSYVGTSLNHDNLLVQQHPSSRKKIPRRQRVVAHVVRFKKKIKKGKKKGRAHILLTLWHAYVNVHLRILGDTGVYSWELNH